MARDDAYLAIMGVLLERYAAAGALVADVGCGDGCLVMAAARLVGAGGGVYAIDTSRELLHRLLDGSPPSQVLPLRTRPGVLPVPDGALDLAVMRRGGCWLLPDVLRTVRPGGAALVLSPDGSGEPEVVRPHETRSAPAAPRGDAARLNLARELILGPGVYAEILGHCRRKLRGEYGPDETRERKAFGLLSGELADGSRGLAVRAHPLRRNLRYEEPWRGRMDEALARFAEPSETPLAQRGWVADPQEVLAAENGATAGGRIIGSYHMHRVAWERDPERDAATAVDRELARGTGCWTLVVSMVDPELPAMRAFFEGDLAAEIPVRVALR